MFLKILFVALGMLNWFKKLVYQIGLKASYTFLKQITAPQALFSSRKIYFARVD